MRLLSFKWMLGIGLCHLSLGTTPLTDALSKLQNSWDNTKNYQSNFKQVVFSKKLHTKDETRGTIFVSKPGKIRWEIPDQNLIQILNGNRMTQIKENKRRKKTVVDIFRDISKSVDLKSLGFLSGTASFKESYNAVLGAEDTEKIELKLTPKSSPNETYLAEIDKKSYFLRALTTDTADSKVRIDFLKTEINTNLESSLFEYQPKPTDTVHENP
ncbi:MAG: outer membrane lipoprotein carrier protein LolA [Proteobacteria bacterium]|nr:outer membrane lipoprotein carrier protein LolA [Pseudomonadota bacterium]